MEELSNLLGDLFCTNSHSLSEDMSQKIFNLLDEDKVTMLHAILIIMKTCPCNIQIFLKLYKKLKIFSRKFLMFFLILAQKHRL